MLAFCASNLCNFKKEGRSTVCTHIIATIVLKVPDMQMKSGDHELGGIMEHQWQG